MNLQIPQDAEVNKDAALYDTTQDPIFPSELQVRWFIIICVIYTVFQKTWWLLLADFENSFTVANRNEIIIYKVI